MYICVKYTPTVILYKYQLQLSFILYLPGKYVNSKIYTNIYIYIYSKIFQNCTFIIFHGMFITFLWYVQDISIAL